MPGFGGDARLALLSGMVGGLNKKKEAEGENERKRILNEQTAQLLKESAARVKNYGITQEREAQKLQLQESKQTAELAADEAEKASADRFARTSAQAIASRSNGAMSEEDAYALINAGGPAAVRDLWEQTPHPQTEKERLEIQKLRAQTETAINEQQLKEEEATMLRDPDLGALRAAIQTGSPRAEALLFKIREQYPIAGTKWIEKQQDGSLNSDQRAAATAQGSLLGAQQLAAANGDANAAAAAWADYVENNPPEDDEDMISYQAAQAYIDRNKPKDTGVTGDLKARARASMATPPAGG